MYLISAYFDEETEKTLARYRNKIAEKTGNTFLLDHNVPPHMTISSIEARQGADLIPYIERLNGRIGQGEIQLVSVGALFPYVLYVAPVLNTYLLELSVQVYKSVKDFPDGKISRFYRPMQWMPHVTVGKTLDKKQMQCGFQVMQEQFVPLSGKIVKLGLAKTNPHRDIWQLELL